MRRDMKGYKEKTVPVYPVPRSVQELIPVSRIAEDGIFELENLPEGAKKLYDKAYLFLDTNFAVLDEEEQRDFLKLYCSVLNSLNVSFKVCIMNNNRDMEQARKELFIRCKDTRYEGIVESFNSHIGSALSGERGGIWQARLFILSVKRDTPEQAREYFRSIESNLALAFRRMQSELIPLDAAGRLRFLYAFYRMGQEGEFQFDFQEAVRRRADWRDLISPRVIKHWQDEYGKFDGITLQVDERYVRAFYVPVLPNSVNTQILDKLMGGPWKVILTLDAAAIPQEVARKRLEDLYLQNARIIEKQQEVRNKAGAWSSDITYDRRRQKEDLESYMDILNDNDEKMFYLGIYAVLTAESKQELENQAVAFCSAAEGEGLRFAPAILEQIETVNTALPTGARFCTRMSPVFTQPLAAFAPFVVHELSHPDGLFYGINQISKNILSGNRKKLQNGNGFILGVSGGGKGMEAKQEMIQVLLRTEDEVLVIDPQNEYRDIAKYMGGQFVDFGSGRGHNINPLDTDTLEYMDPRAFVTDKTELMCGIFSQILGGEITAQEKSVIGRCVRLVYGQTVKHVKKRAPTLNDYYTVMQSQPEEQAYDLQLALELFVTGALNMFAQPTNVNVNNRFVVYGTADLGQEQSGIGMLIMLESIRARIARNAKRGKATWLYIDELHNLAYQEYAARYLEKIWKEVRKMGGLCTGMTQNIVDILPTKQIETMLYNSEYISLLNQADAEAEILGQVLGISDPLLAYVHNSERGCGLLKFGDVFIPKDNRLPKDSVMYQLFNTDFHEIQAARKRKKELKAAVERMPNDVRQVIEDSPTEGEKVYP